MGYIQIKNDLQKAKHIPKNQINSTNQKHSIQSKLRNQTKRTKLTINNENHRRNHERNQRKTNEEETNTIAAIKKKNEPSHVSMAAITKHRELGFTVTSFYQRMKPIF